VVDANKASLAVYGAQSVEELKGELSKVLTRESQVTFRDELVALSEGRPQFTKEFDNQTLTGETRHVNVILSVIPEFQESLEKVLVCLVDLTPQNQLEKELRSARDELEHVLATNPAVLFFEEPLADFSDTLSTFVSESARFVLGFEPKHFLGEAGLSFWRSRLHPDDLARYSAELPSLWRDGHHTFEYRFLHGDGNYRWISEQYRVVRDADGRILNAVAVAIDVTERKQIEEKLAKSQRLAAIGETAAMVGHDLRNPLQGITSATYLLREDNLTREERNKALSLIDDSVDRASQIVSDLLDYSSEIHLAPAEISPKEVVRSALETVKIPDTIQLHNHSQEQPGVMVDLEKMRRVFINLITNAVDAMPNGGILTISSRQSKHFIEIAISDTGTGLDQQILENLWKPLQTTKTKGMGLGLPIVKRIIDAHGGEVLVESKTGLGTTFTIRLPIKSAAEIKA